MSPSDTTIRVGVIVTFLILIVIALYVKGGMSWGPFLDPPCYDGYRGDCVP